MRLPEKIKPDRLKDAIVEIGYNCSLPVEILIGSIYQSVDDSYTYSNRPFEDDNSDLEFDPTVIVPLFYNDKIKLLLLPNRMVFNILENYIGWNDYKTEIQKLLGQILEKNSSILEFTRASVRYISEYRGLNLIGNFKFTFTYGLPNIKSDVFTFRSEFVQDGLKIFLNLRNQIKVLDDQDRILKPLSTVDIDVLNDDLSCNTLSEIISGVEKAHHKQKEIFFSIIDENFLKALKPEYNASSSE